jgi:DNA-binding response OmpR family regulator
MVCGLWGTELSTKILIVDDDKALVDCLQQTLLLDPPGYEVDSTYSGEEALSKLANAACDLIL